MWEDTFTGLCKFRARWLMRAGDLPHDAAKRLQKSREEACVDRKNDSPQGKAQRNRDDGKMDEVFLTPRTEDLELQSVVKPVTLSVSKGNQGSDGEAPAKNVDKRDKKAGPKLVHAYCPSSGEFTELSDSDGILARARVRLAANASSLSDKDKDKEGGMKRGPAADGWLPHKSRALQTRGRGRARGRGAGRGGNSRAAAKTKPSTTTSSRSRSPSNFLEDESDESEAVPEADDEPWEEGDDGDSDSENDAGAGNGGSVASGGPKSSDDANAAAPTRPTRPRRSQRPPALSDSSSAVAPGHDGEGKSSRPTPVTPQQMPRRPRAPVIRRHGPLPPRPRRLAMPPTIGQGLPKGAANSASVGRTSAFSAPRVTPSATPHSTTRLASGKGKASTPHSSPSSTAAEADPERSAGPPSKRKKGVPAAAGGKPLGVGPSHYPPRRTPVGKDYQADIPDLLPPDERDASIPPAMAARIVSSSTPGRVLDAYCRAALGWILSESSAAPASRSISCGVDVSSGVVANGRGFQDDHAVSLGWPSGDVRVGSGVGEA